MRSDVEDQRQVDAGARCDNAALGNQLCAQVLGLDRLRDPCTGEDGLVTGIGRLEHLAGLHQRRQQQHKDEAACPEPQLPCSAL